MWAVARLCAADGQLCRRGEPAAGATDQSRLDLLQGFAEVDLGPLTLRGGRQMVSLGTERLVGTRYGPNTPLAFDGARLLVRAGAPPSACWRCIRCRRACAILTTAPRPPRRCGAPMRC
jgi:hypothetical protein